MHNSWIENKKICPPVPLGWEWIPLKDVTQVQGGFAFHSSDFTTFGIPVVRMSDLKQGMLDLSKAVKVSDQTGCQLSQFMLKKEDLIIGMSGSITNYAIVDEQNLPAYLNQRVGRLILKDKNKANYNYLTHVLRSPFYESWAYKEATGVAQLNISSQQIEAMYFLLPPLLEQRRIAEILDTIDETIQKTEALISKLKATKQGLLHDLLTSGLDENGKLRDLKAHPEQFKDSPLGMIPKEWKPVRLLDVVSIPNGQVDPKRKPYCHWSLIAPDHIESATGRLLCLETATEQGAISGKYAFKPGDVLYSKIRPYLRKAVLADRQGLCSADMYPLQPKPSLVPRFLLDAILGEHFSRFVTSVSERSGFPKINRKELGEYRLALPSRDEQLHIATVMNAHDTRIRTEEQYRDKLKLQKKGLMHDLLTGKVRVQI